MKTYTCIGNHMMNGVAYSDGEAVELNDQDAASFRALGFIGGGEEAGAEVELERDDMGDTGGVDAGSGDGSGGDGAGEDEADGDASDESGDDYAATGRRKKKK